MNQSRPERSSPRARAPRANEDLPEVIVDFEYSDGMLFIVIENIGAAPAYAIRTSFDHAINGVGGEKTISRLNVFRRLLFLPPRKRIRVFVDAFESYVKRKQPLRVESTVAYRSKDGKRLSDIVVHDLSVYRDIIEVPANGRVAETGLPEAISSVEGF